MYLYTFGGYSFMIMRSAQREPVSLRLGPLWAPGRFLFKAVLYSEPFCVISAAIVNEYLRFSPLFMKSIIQRMDSLLSSSIF